MTSADARNYLNALPRFGGEAGAGYQPGLGRIRALLTEMGDPHERYRSVHVAGTNGKGSTASFLAAIGTAVGLKTGLHTSPELFDLTERMRINGKPAPDDWLTGAVTRYRSSMETVRPTFFEATVALSFLYFADEEVDLAVVEVGLGGRLDATNVLQPEGALITRIGRDHTALLGETLPAIAREKAGIVKPGVPVLMSKNEAAAREAVQAVAKRCKAPWHYVPDEVAIECEHADVAETVLDVRSPRHRYEQVAVGLPGRHQRDNALLALRAAEEVLTVDADAIRQGLRNVCQLAGLRGRGEVLQQEPLVVVDVAHNPGSLRAVLQDARGEADQRDGRLFVMLGLLRDKDLPGIAEELLGARATVCPVVLEASRAVPARTLAEQLAETGVSVGEPGRASAREAAVTLRRLMQPEDVLLATGSHHVAAELMAAGTFAPPVRTIT